MRKLAVISMLALTGCGAAQNATPSATETITQGGQGVVYDLTATLDADCTSHSAKVTVTQAAAVKMPQILVSISNANFVGRATLVIGDVFCDYVSDSNGVYVRQDGACNTFNPKSVIHLKPGNTVSLTLQGCPSQPTSAEGTINGTVE